MKKLIILLLALSTCAFGVSALRIGLSPGTYYGDTMGGVAGADANCQAAFSGSGGTWKALLAGANRYLGGSDWVLEANTNYTRMDGSTLIGTTNATEALTSPLTNAINDSYGFGTYAWTGLNAGTYLPAVGYSCTYWTATGYGFVGDAYTTLNGYWINPGTFYPCESSQQRLYCVEQAPPVPPPVPEFSTITIILAALVAIGGVVVMRRRF